MVAQPMPAVANSNGISTWYDADTLIYLVDEEGVTIGDTGDIKKSSKCMTIIDEEHDALLIFVRNDK